MKIITEQKKILPILGFHSNKFGHTAEHNPHFLMYTDITKGHNIKYFDFGADGGIVFYNKDGCWHAISEPITKSEDKISILKNSLEFIFKDPNTERVLCEDYSKEFRKEVVSSIKDLGLRAVRPLDIFYWPVYSLLEMPETLEGKKFKSMRYAKSRFYNNYRVAFKDALQVDKSVLFTLLNTWIKHRKAKDEILANDYIKFIENGFPKCDIRRALFLNNLLKGFTVGWHVPNSDTHYLFLNIHDYSDAYLGDFITTEHFLEAKNKGYKFLDFGGSDKKSLSFKKKFSPSNIYKTCNFSIRRS